MKFVHFNRGHVRCWSFRHLSHPKISEKKWLFKESWHQQNPSSYNTWNSMDAQNLQPPTKITGYFENYLQTNFILEDLLKGPSFLCAQHCLDLWQPRLVQQVKRTSSGHSPLKCWSFGRHLRRSASTARLHDALQFKELFLIRDGRAMKGTIGKTNELI